MSFAILLLTLGLVGVGTWGLTDSIKNTDHQVDTAWGLVDDASNTVRLLPRWHLVHSTWSFV